MEAFEVTRANITRVSLVVLEPNGMRSRDDKISFFITLFKQVVCKQDSNYQSVNWREQTSVCLSVVKTFKLTYDYIQIKEFYRTFTVFNYIYKTLCVLALHTVMIKYYRGPFVTVWRWDIMVKLLVFKLKPVSLCVCFPQDVRPLSQDRDGSRGLRYTDKFE